MRYRCTQCNKVVTDPKTREYKHINDLEALNWAQKYDSPLKRGKDLLKPMSEEESDRYIALLKQQIEKQIEKAKEEIVGNYWHMRCQRSLSGCGHGFKMVYCGPLKEEKVDQFYEAVEHFIGEKI